MKNSYRKKQCRLCKSAHLRRVLHYHPMPLPDEYLTADTLRPQPAYPLDLMLCMDCGHVQLSHVVNPKIIYREYIYETVSSLGLVQHFDAYASHIVSSIRPEEGSLVVDIGSNDGTLLAAFKRRGMRVLGVDPAVHIAQAASDAGILTIPENFTVRLVRTLIKNHGKAHIITANNIYANVDDLDDMTDAVRELLRDDGVFIMESYYLVDVIQNMVFDFIYHEHLSSFTVVPLQAYFSSKGMELIDVQHIPTKGGSLRYVVQLKGGRRRPSSSVRTMANFESRFGVHTPSIYKRFEKRINSAKERLLHLLKKIKREGKTIAGYGASASTTTLIYHFALQKTLSFLIDEYPRKHHTFSPGCHIPVLPPSAISERKPEYIVILAWRYAEPIIEKNQEYLRQGGKFIVPLPKLKIISSDGLSPKRE